ncbi:hypothetical protein [Roseomonas sp. WA12]
MPIENAARIDQLDATNPLDTDPVRSSAPHIRLIKQALKSTFPNVTEVISASSEQINRVIGRGAVPGVLAVEAPASATEGAQIDLEGAANGPVFSIDRLPNIFRIFSSLANRTLPVIHMTIDRVSGWTAFSGPVSSPAIMQDGNRLVPYGAIVPFYLSAPPLGWLLCDGTNGTPDLRNRFILGGLTPEVGATGGAASYTASTSSNGGHGHIVVAAGAHSHGISILEAGSHNHGGATHGASLTVDQLPPHTHGTYHPTGSGVISGPTAAWAGTATVPDQTEAAGSGAAHAHGINADGVHTHGVSMNADGSHGHGIEVNGEHSHTVTTNAIPPFYKLIFCMKA